MKLKTTIAIGTIGILLNGCAGLYTITPNNSEAKSQSVKFKEQEIYDRAIRENKDRWVKIGENKTKKVVEKYTDELKALEAGKYAVKSKFLTYPKVVATHTADGKLILEVRKPRIQKNMSVKDIFHYYANNDDLMEHQTQNTPRLSQGSYAPTLQSTALGIPTLDNVPKSAPFSVSTATQNTRYIQPNQQSVVSSNRDKQISLNLPKTQKSLNAMNEYGLKCMDSGSNYVCDFRNKMERDYFCKETRVCK